MSGLHDLERNVGPIIRCQLLIERSHPPCHRRDGILVTPDQLYGQSFQAVWVFLVQLHRGNTRIVGIDLRQCFHGPCCLCGQVEGFDQFVVDTRRIEPVQALQGVGEQFSRHHLVQHVFQQDPVVEDQHVKEGQQAIDQDPLEGAQLRIPGQTAAVHAHAAVEHTDALQPSPVGTPRTVAHKIARVGRERDHAAQTVAAQHQILAGHPLRDVGVHLLRPQTDRVFDTLGAPRLRAPALSQQVERVDGVAGAGERRRRLPPISGGASEAVDQERRDLGLPLGGRNIGGEGYLGGNSMSLPFPRYIRFGRQTHMMLAV
mmetsp:Transcript_6993/g.14555  ORF Transcript_6993/g.14555 Transcript_6993/m.14555 type:complete len:316 (-) Transcript_6993:181-1128(-)